MRQDRPTTDCRDIKGREWQSPCPFGCIFDGEGKLYGDCRIPWSKDCYLNQQNDDKE